MASYKVRFNLSKGKNYMKWKVQHPDYGIQYYDPEKVQLYMKGCLLKNNLKTAISIYKGAHKSVCAWILCDELIVFPVHKKIHFIDSKKALRVRYNPRINPYWTIRSKNVDGLHIDALHTYDWNLFKTPKLVVQKLK